MTIRSSACLLLLAVALALFGRATLSPPVGLFHDDGIYAATAESLAEGRGYRVISVPTEPAQSKYPMLYPLLLAAVWRMAPHFPDNVSALQLVGTVATACLLFGAAYLKRGLVDDDSLASDVAFVIALGLSPLVTTMGVMILSDTTFAALCVALWLIQGRADRRTSWWLTLGGALLAALLMNTRRLGVVFVMTFAIQAWRAGRRHFVGYLALTGALVVGAWFATPSVTPVSNPLLEYYSGYETNLIASLLRSPSHALAIAGSNIVYAGRGLAELLLPVPVIGVPWLLAILAALGCPTTLRRAGTTTSLGVLLYVVLVLVYPFNPTRYLLPLTPIILIALFNGTAAVASAAMRWVGTRQWPLVRSASYVPIALLLLTNLAWGWWNFQGSRTERLRLWAGVPAPYSWQGFEETIDWINAHTPQDTVLAAAYDPLYYLHTGRRGVRPWFHQPDTYFYPLNDRRPNVGAAGDIRVALDALGVTLLVVDPVDGYAEQTAVDALFPALVAEYGSRASLAFQSTDSRHLVYRIAPYRPARSAPSS